MFFNLQDDNYVRSLYVTDGTVGNTIILKDVSTILQLVNFDNHIYFSDADAVNGVALWKTDGTVNGTVLVAPLGLGAGASVAVNYTVIGNKLFFAAGDGIKQLYVLVAGTNTPVLLSSTIYDTIDLTAFNGKVYFSASPDENNLGNREIFISDGTVAGTKMLKNIRPGDEGSLPGGFIVFNNKLFFSANDGVLGNEIWSTDGTESGTQLFKDINPGIGNGINYLTSAVYNNKLYFAANDGINGSELWSSDGTSSGTSLLKDIGQFGDSSPMGFVTVNDKLLMAADDGTHGYEIWVTDGTAQNTNLLLDINPGIGAASYALYKTNVLCDNQLFFDADNGGNNIEPWVTDGTPAGTHLIEDLNPTGGTLDYDTRYVQLYDKIFFAGVTSANGRQLYVMDATCILGVKETNAVDFKIYPNPATNILNIETTVTISRIEIYNNLGQLVLNSGENNTQLDVSALSSGLYIMKITGENATISTHKIVIE